MHKEGGLYMFYRYGRYRNYNYNYNYYYNNNGFNAYQFIILVLIVLQWMLTPTDDPNNLVNNGGLFIITLFGLVMCSCAFTPQIVYAQVPYRRRLLFNL